MWIFLVKVSEKGHRKLPRLKTISGLQKTTFQWSFQSDSTKGSFNIYVDVTLLFLSASLSKHGPRNDNVAVISNCTMILRGQKESKGSLKEGKKEKRKGWEKGFCMDHLSASHVHVVIERPPDWNFCSPSFSSRFGPVSFTLEILVK